MSTSELTVEETAESLNGFDEQAIKKTFGAPVGKLGAEDPTQFMRALVFVCRRRDGEDDMTAYNAAQTMSMGEVNGYFAEESVESGKDAGTPSETPTTSPLGAS